MIHETETPLPVRLLEHRAGGVERFSTLHHMDKICPVGDANKIENLQKMAMEMPAHSVGIPRENESVAHAQAKIV